MSSSEFCPDCQNLLYPKEDREFRQLLYYCNSCNYTDFADSKSKEKNTVEFTAFNFRTKDDIHSYIAAGLGDDPTLPRSPDRVCSQCNHPGAVYLQLPDRVADEAMVIVYICSKCNYFDMDNQMADTNYDAEEEEFIKEEGDEVDITGGDDFNEIDDDEDDDDADLFGGDLPDELLG